MHGKWHSVALSCNCKPEESTTLTASSARIKSLSSSRPVPPTSQPVPTKATADDPRKAFSGITTQIFSPHNANEKKKTFFRWFYLAHSVTRLKVVAFAAAQSATKRFRSEWRKVVSILENNAIHGAESPCSQSCRWQFIAVDAQACKWWPNSVARATAWQVAPLRATWPFRVNYMKRERSQKSYVPGCKSFVQDFFLRLFFSLFGERGN